MKLRSTLTIALLTASVAVAAHATDYSLDDGEVHFSAPDAWTAIMEKHDGDPQFLALEVQEPNAPPDTLARITVTTQHAGNAQAFQKFVNDNVAKARRLTEYHSNDSHPIPSGRRYTATENKQKTDYTEYYYYRNGVAIQVRCVRPVAAQAAWAATFDAGCSAIAKDVSTAQ
ncbi:MAG TPA: hypothetical protein VFK08_07820 [Rhodanobacteraceae bacterium]|jgi:hypothetical protein|nr:hypothetical protein [Rhodanobacteraceae bacterium]